LLWWLSWPDGGGMARIQDHSLVGIYARCRLEAQSISQIAHGYPARGYTRSMTALQTSSDYCLGTITRAGFSCTQCAASDESRFCMRCSNGLVGCSKPYVSTHVLHILNPASLIHLSFIISGLANNIRATIIEQVSLSRSFFCQQFSFSPSPVCGENMNDNMLKGPSQTTGSRNSIELANTIAVSEKHGTQSDERDMDRMGKLQELRVCSTCCAAEKL
jgi:hypothetical protein